MSLSCQIEIQPGEKLVLPPGLVDTVGPGKWIITIQSLDETAPPLIRTHNAFLAGYAPEDDGLYDANPTR
jgi:hypothetical protein